NRGFADLGLFEVGQAYRGNGPEDQFMAACGVRAGAAPLIGSGRHWAGAAAEVGLFDAQADVVAPFGGLGFAAMKGQITPDVPPRLGSIPGVPGLCGWARRLCPPISARSTLKFYACSILPVPLPPSRYSWARCRRNGARG